MGVDVMCIVFLCFVWFVLIVVVFVVDVLFLLFLVCVEVDVLLSCLQFLGCEFNCNGSWYGGVEVCGYLLKKLDYFEGKDLVKIVEQFIECGVFGSSMSGKLYLVCCVGQVLVESVCWLLVEL